MSKDRKGFDELTDASNPDLADIRSALRGEGEWKRQVPQLARAASTSANVAQGAVAPDGRVVDKAMVKRLAVQYGLLPEQTADVAQGAEAVRALFQPWPEGELGPTDEPESQYRLGYNTAIEDALDALTAAQSGDKS